MSKPFTLSSIIEMVDKMYISQQLDKVSLMTEEEIKSKIKQLVLNKELKYSVIQSIIKDNYPKYLDYLNYLEKLLILK